MAIALLEALKGKVLPSQNIGTIATNLLKSGPAMTTAIKVASAAPAVLVAKESVPLFTTITNGLQQGASILTSFYQGQQQVNAAQAAADQAKYGTQYPAVSTTSVQTDGGSSLLMPLILVGGALLLVQSIGSRRR